MCCDGCRATLDVVPAPAWPTPVPPGLASPWAARTPVAVEVPFEMTIGGTVVRGRIAAVSAEPDGGATVVDWKTGEAPRGSEAARHAAKTEHLGQLKERVAARRGRNIATVAAARKLIGLVFYGLRDHEIRCLRRAGVA